MLKETGKKVASNAANTLRKGTTSRKTKSTARSAFSQRTRTPGVAALRRLFDELGERYKDRPGGYTRIIKLGRRDGELAIIELVDSPREHEAIERASKRTKSGGAGKKQTAKASQSKTSAKLRDGRASSKSKSAAGSALSQLRNPRSGHFVKIDKAAGTIVAHKKSRGAYKGVSIAETISSRK